MTVLPTLIYPESRGTVHLAGPEPSLAPLIDPGYLRSGKDADVLMEGIAMVRQTMAGLRDSEGELVPGPAYEDEAELRRDHPELYKLQPVNTAYQPKKTSWGDPDLRGTWPIDSLGGLPLQRSEAMCERVYLSDAEYEAREKQMDQWRNAAAAA